MRRAPKTAPNAPRAQRGTLSVQSPVEEVVADGRPCLRIDGQTYPTEAVVEVLSRHVLDERLARMQGVLAARVGRVVLAVENLHHSHNGAACVRTAEAMGLQDLVTVESLNVFPLYDPEASDRDVVHSRRVTRLTDRWLTVHRLESAAALRSWADERDMQVWGAAPLARASLEDVPAERPVVLLFGNESKGLLPETLAVCDSTFRIPMHGFVESFNISVSVGITLHALLGRVRAGHPDGGGGDLPALRRQTLLARWLFEDVRAADLILRRELPRG